MFKRILRQIPTYIWTVAKVILRVWLKFRHISEIENEWMNELHEWRKIINVKSVLWPTNLKKTGIFIHLLTKSYYLYSSKNSHIFLLWLTLNHEVLDHSVKGWPLKNKIKVIVYLTREDFKSQLFFNFFYRKKKTKSASFSLQFIYDLYCLN